MLLKPLFFVVLAASMIVSSDAWARNYYRYVNDEGRKVMTQTLPPNVVHRGYEVLNDRGMVIEVVPRAMTPEELEALATEEKARLDDERQAERDKMLLSIFSSPQDAERARDRKVDAIDGYINITRGNILKLKSEYDHAQAQAAEKERAGQAVPDFLVEKMDSFGRQISEAEASILEREQEKEQIREEYQKDIDRLKYLKDKRANGMAGK